MLDLSVAVTKKLPGARPTKPDPIRAGALHD